MEITRETTIDAPADEVWDALVDDDDRAAWLGDDGADRPLRIDESVPGQRLTWTWWPNPEAGSDGGSDGGADGTASTVTISLRPIPTGGTAVRVVERLVAPTPRVVASARRAWGRRLLGVELLLIAARVRA